MYLHIDIHLLSSVLSIMCSSFQIHLKTPPSREIVLPITISSNLCILELYLNCRLETGFDLLIYISLVRKCPVFWGSWKCRLAYPCVFLLAVYTTRTVLVHSLGLGNSYEFPSLYVDNNTYIHTCTCIHTIFLSIYVSSEVRDVSSVIQQSILCLVTLSWNFYLHDSSSLSNIYRQTRAIF